ncbi:MAG: hypothetical protein AAB535_03455 [Patescibacteria group bacterium]
MKIKTFVDSLFENLEDYVLKVKMNRNAFLSVGNIGGVATINISQTQIKGTVKHKDGTETKLKTIDIKVKS